jgi:hypothetical protein
MRRIITRITTVVTTTTWSISWQDDAAAPAPEDLDARVVQVDKGKTEKLGDEPPGDQQEERDLNDR